MIEVAFPKCFAFKLRMLSSHPYEKFGFVVSGGRHALALQPVGAMSDGQATVAQNPHHGPS